MSSTTKIAEADDDESQPTAQGPTLSRRRMLQGVAGAGVAVAAGPRLMTGEAEAIAPLVVGGAIAGGAVLGWATRVGWEALTADDMPEGLTPEVLKTNVYDITRKRQSNDQSTFVDNQNIVGLGLKDSLYAEGKKTGIEELNAESTESDVLAAAKSAAESQSVTVKKNFLKSWNESTNELGNMLARVVSHPDLSKSDAFPAHGDEIVTDYDEVNDVKPSFSLNDLTVGEREVTLSDGSTMMVNRVTYDLEVTWSDSSDVTSETFTWDAISGNKSYDIDNGGGYYATVEPTKVLVDPLSDAEAIRYLGYSDWNSVWSLLDTAESDVKTGLDTWVTNVYGQVQAGELETAELLTPRELAEMTADDEQFPQAVADLLALNIPVDLEREAEIYLPDKEVTLYGMLAPSSVPENPPVAGDTVDPSSRDEDYYFTYDVSQGEGSWSAYETGVDGGNVTFTSEPFKETVYYIDTAAGETAEVRYEDFSESTDASSWVADVSDQLETSITEVEAVEFFATVEETTFETVQLREAFDLVTYRDSEGTEVSEASFTQNEPQDDTNYISEEEWQAMADRQEELIQKYEDASSGGVAIGDWVPGVGTNGTIGLVVVGGVVGLGVVSKLNPFN